MNTLDIIKSLPEIPEIPDDECELHSFLMASLWGDISITWSDDIPMGEYRNEVKAGQFTFECELTVATTITKYICNSDNTLRSEPMNVRFYRIIIVDRSNLNRVYAIGSGTSPSSATMALLTDINVRCVVREWMKI